MEIAEIEIMITSAGGHTCSLSIDQHSRKWAFLDDGVELARMENDSVGAFLASNGIIPPGHEKAWRKVCKRLNQEVM